MSESLGSKQRRFSLLAAKLITRIYMLGYECTLGDAFRDPRVHGAVGVKLGYGHPSSAHKNKLAIDLNLFKNGEYLSSTAAHASFGAWWELQDPDARWGGNFPGDGNHYSFKHDGVK